MRLVGGSTLSDHELWQRARRLLAEHGDEAKVKVAQHLDAARIANDNADYATWVNVSLCLIQLSASRRGEAQR